MADEEAILLKATQETFLQTCFENEEMIWDKF